MQDRERLQEIEEIGEQEENEEELQNESVRSGHSIVPLVQTAVCVLILLALLFLKYTDQERYQSVTGFYQKAAEEEIELPKLPVFSLQRKAQILFSQTPIWTKSDEEYFNPPLPISFFLLCAACVLLCGDRHRRRRFPFYVCLSA